MIFKDPWVLLFIPIVIIVVFVLQRRQSPASFRFSSTKILFALPKSLKMKLNWVPQVLRIAILVLFLIALAGPRLIKEETVHKSEGIDIVLAIDSSGSMAAEDFKISSRRVNRLEIVKKVVQEFIEQRSNDRIGLVAFAGLAYTVCPLTTDYTWLEENLKRVELGLIDDGTAVGSAITSAIARLKNSNATSKVVVLLTDGVNNAGKIDPVSAARAAEAFGVKIYTIGAGTKGYVPFPTIDFFGRKVYQNVVVDLDEDTLKQVAEITGGQYFRATDTESLRQVYDEIDLLEKTEIEEIGYFEYTELFSQWLISGLILLLFEILLTNTIFLKIP